MAKPGLKDVCLTVKSMHLTPGPPGDLKDPSVPRMCNWVSKRKEEIKGFAFINIQTWKGSK